MLLLTTQGSLIWFEPVRPSDLAGVVRARSPLVAIGWLVWGQIRTLRRADERQRVQQLQALAIGFGVLVVLLVGVLGWVGASAVTSAGSR